MTTSTLEAPPPGRTTATRARLRKWFVTLLLIALVLTLLFLFFSPDIIVSIGPGEAGVLWKRFDGGTVTVANDGTPFIGRIHPNSGGEATRRIENIADAEDSEIPGGHRVYPYGEGTRVIAPWNEMFIYNIRLQQTSHKFGVLTNDGLEVQAEIAITWKPIEADLGLLHRDVGPDYLNVLLLPIVGSCARGEIARFKPDALYSPLRLEIQETIRDCVKSKLRSRFYPEVPRQSYVIIEDVLIRDVDLPQEVNDAIQAKVAQKHISESYQYRLERERLEADRKAIEAEGIQRFQAIINSTISDGYLKWKGIDATLELAKSPNAKVVVIGAGGGDGMPIILGNMDSTPGIAAPTARPAVAAAAPRTSAGAAATPVTTAPDGRLADRPGRLPAPAVNPAPAGNPPAGNQ